MWHKPDTMKKKPRCYNSGPISSLSPIAAWYNFERADRLIADELQMQPVNPMKVTWGIRSTAPWLVHMIKDIILLLTCSDVYFQPGWEKSRGARWEFKTAAFFGLNIWMGCGPEKIKPTC